MALTDHSDIFVSFHEDGFNRFLDHARQQRPSIFNHATQAVADNPDLLCQVIKAHPIVSARANPLVTIVDPLPVPGTDYGVDFAVQLVECNVDFHPGDDLVLPPQLSPPLKAQRMALYFRVCGGLGCPPRDILDQYVPPPPNPDEKHERDEEERDVLPLPARQLICFCLNAYALGGVRIREYWGKPWLEPFLDGFEIVDIEPEGLENSLECYIQLVLRLAVLPQLRYLLEIAPLDIIKDKIALVLSPEPNSPDLPNNPAIEEDLLKAFIHVEVT
jgi:hypothetical protein